MSRPAFFDTNIIVYTDDRSSPDKQQRAKALFAEHRSDASMVVSLQVLQEYFTIATRKLGVPAEIAQHKVEILTRARVVRFEPEDIIAGIELHRLVSISFWDALIVHAARKGGVDVLYSEDLQNGSRIGGVRIVNPFV
jgi:predicted nucleic acid-binding protein